MTRDECKAQLNRLARGYDVKLRELQLDAFFERFKGDDLRDFTEAVTTLLCAPKFPHNYTVIVAEVQKAREARLQREKKAMARDHEKAFNRPLYQEPTKEDEAFAKLCRLIILAKCQQKKHVIPELIKVFLQNDRYRAWAERAWNNLEHPTPLAWLQTMKEAPNENTIVPS